MVMLRKMSGLVVLLVSALFRVSDTFVIDGTIPQDFTWETTTPTPPPGCQLQNKPYDGPCGGCECVNWSGRWEWSCYMATCTMPPCVDSVTKPGQCCPVCPNGANCDINGKILPVGESLELPDGSVCYCNEPKYYYKGPAEVTCLPPTPPPTTTPAGCQGQPKPDYGPCAYCECADWSGRWEWACMIADCIVPPCVDAVSSPGQCCQVCPNGPNCYIDGQIVPAGETYELPDGGICQCGVSNNYWERPEVMCIPPTPPPTTPPSCEGQPNPFDNPCATCECDASSGSIEWMCYMVDCFPAPCVDSHTPPGQCCASCPNGPNCQQNGVIIALNETKLVSVGLECHCSYETIYNPPEPVCRSITTTTTTTTPKPTTPKPTTKPTTTPKPTTPKPTTKPTTTPKPTTTTTTTKAPTTKPTTTKKTTPKPTTKKPVVAV